MEKNSTALLLLFAVLLVATGSSPSSLPDFFAYLIAVHLTDVPIHEIISLILPSHVQLLHVYSQVSLPVSVVDTGFVIFTA